MPQDNLNLRSPCVTAARLARASAAHAGADAPLGYQIEIYRMMHETQRYEGDGIWNRFNIVITLNMVLLGVVGFLSTSPPPDARFLILCLSLGGILLALWAIYVLRRLWLWHVHWKEMLRDIEEGFPNYLPRPLATRPSNLHKSPRWYQSWLLAYTQPFLIVLLALWLALAVFTLARPDFPGADLPATDNTTSDAQEVGANQLNRQRAR